jgi:PTS system mannose-specific IIA component
MPAQAASADQVRTGSETQAPPDAPRLGGKGGGPKAAKGGPKVGIILASHADFGAAILRTAEFIMGPLSDCTSITVEETDMEEDTVRRLAEAAKFLDVGAGVLVLTDMFGGTPSNLALALLDNHKVEVVTGMNLPMVLKVFSSRERDLEELATLAGEAGIKGIVIAGSMLRAKSGKVAEQRAGHGHEHEKGQEKGQESAQAEG